MPTYAFRNTKTDEVFEVFMRMSQREQYLKDNPHLVQTFVEPPQAGNRFIEIDSIARKTPSDYKEMLKSMKKKNPGSTINTFGT